MRFVFLDSTAIPGVTDGPGAPAYFSRHLIERLRAQDHEVETLSTFDLNKCAAADIVVSEWCNEPAFEAAASNVCKRLVLRMRGFDMWGPLDRLPWQNVSALVYESGFIATTMEPFIPAQVPQHVIPSGVDLARFTSHRARGYKTRPVVALIARATADKGQQLAIEWARTRQDIELHLATALGHANPRLMMYLRGTIPSNVTLHFDVDTAKWLDEIKATHILSASIYETLGYSIVEGMAMGCKPLIHAGEGLKSNWPSEWIWLSLQDLNRLVDEPGHDDYRSYVESHYNAEEGSNSFIQLVESLPAREVDTPPQHIKKVVASVHETMQAGNLDVAEALVSHVRANTTSDFVLRADLAAMLATAYYVNERLDQAGVWALRSMSDGPRPECMALLGDIALDRDDIEAARSWFYAAFAAPRAPSMLPPLLTLQKQILDGLERTRTLLDPVLPLMPEPQRYLFVVSGRNVGHLIKECIKSIERQTQAFPRNRLGGVAVVVIDDASDPDKRSSIVGGFYGFSDLDLIVNTERKWALRNTVEAIQQHGRPGDVIVLVDGDDKLNSVDALVRIHAAYLGGAWCTYGNFATDSNTLSWMAPYTRKVVQAGTYREAPFSASHPLTFRKELFDKIDQKDFLDDKGEWFKFAYDAALFLPMLEMARERAVYIPDPIYVYNMSVEEPERKYPEEQTRVRDQIYAKTPYPRLDSLDDPAPSRG